jgi:Flp pilus assembly protein TadG
MNAARRQSGFALIETLLLGLLFLIPLVWALAVLAELHQAALASTAAAREAGIDAARASNMVDAGMAVEDAVARAFADEGLEVEDAHVAWSAGAGLERDTTVEVEVSYPVTVLQVPLLGSVSGPSIWVRAAHSVRVDPYRSVE